jgi:hypothetical protein
MRTRFIFLNAVFFLCTSLYTTAQINIQVKVKSISVSTVQDCDAGGADNSDFVFEFKAEDNSPSAFTNNTPVAGSIGMCNYAYVNEHNGPFNFPVSSPGAAVFSPTTGLFFDRSYNCKNDIPTSLVLTWTAYENDDSSTPSVAPVANGTIAPQVTTYTVPTTNGTYTTQFTQASSDGACPQTYVIEFELRKSVGSFSPLMISFVEAHTICNGATDGSVEATAGGGSGTVLNDWSFDGLGDYNDNLTETGLGAGTYTLVVKDALNCTDTAVVTLMSVAPPSALSGFTASSATVCTGQNNVVYTVPFQSDVFYNWSYSTAGTSINGAGNSITIDFLNFASNGVLSVYGVNSCSTSPTLTMAVTVLSSPSISVSGNTTVCDNAQETLTASGAASYTWSTNENTAGIVVSPTVATVYTVTGLGANGCVSSSQYSISVLPSPTVQVSGSTASVCPNETVAVTATGNGNLFIWSDGFFGASHNVKALSTTVFTVTNTFTNSCYAQATYTLHVKPGPVMAITGNTIVCEATTVSLTATGADSYTWSDGVTTNTNTFLPASTTTLMVVGQLLNGCKDSIVQTIKVLSTPTVNITGADTICQGQFTTLTATANGTVSYGWNSGANTQSISVSPAGTFTYVATAYNGACSGTASHEVAVKLIPAIDFEIPATPLCTDAPPFTFTANPSGGTYTGTGVTADTFDPSVGAGTYTITYEVTVSNGCLATDTETIGVMTCTGINALNQAAELNLFPNPATDAITVSSGKQIAHISIYDFTGKLVKLVETNAIQETVSIRELAGGLYTVTVLMQDQSQATVKVVKE